MKKRVFEEYLTKVLQLFNLSEENFFNVKRDRTISNARYMLFFLCKRRGIGPTEIIKYVKERGFEVKHPSIIIGANTFKQKIMDDNDYAVAVSRIENSVTV